MHVECTDMCDSKLKAHHWINCNIHTNKDGEVKGF